MLLYEVGSTRRLPHLMVLRLGLVVVSTWTLWRRLSAACYSRSPKYQAVYSVSIFVDMSVQPYLVV